MTMPHRESRPGGTETASQTTLPEVHHDSTCSGRRRPYKPSTGLRASGYREGYAAALRWTQAEFHEHLDEIGRARLAAVVARSEEAA
ncbi:MAG: hypothetical protein QOJ56_2989 [Mycobacterium sp.]|jgi:hypothetical protein|nr:hypothetical protein [Mycobacterium sp.]